MKLVRPSVFTHVLVTLALAATSCGLKPQESSLTDQESHFCVQSFNAYGPSYSTQIDGRTRAWTNELGESPCEILSLQEVWRQSHFVLIQNKLKKGPMPNFTSVRFDDVATNSQGQSGLALFTSLPVIANSFENFTVNKDGILDDARDMFGVVKGMGYSQIQIPGTSSFVHLINLHTHPSSVRVRLAQLAQLFLFVEKMLPLKAPLLLNGDFNFAPDSLEYAILQDALGLVDSYTVTNGGYTTKTCTYCAKNPHHWGGGDRVIDYVFSHDTKDISLEVKTSTINFKERNGVYPSDHYGRRTVYQLTKNGTAPINPRIAETRKEKAAIALEVAAEELTKLSDNKLEYLNAARALRALKARVLSTDSKNPWDTYW